MICKAVVSDSNETWNMGKGVNFESQLRDKFGELGEALHTAVRGT